MAQNATITWSGNAAAAVIRAAAVRGMRVWGEHVLGGARAIVPLDEGPLQHSGTVVMDERKIEATVTFDTPYAVRQHEELSYRHAPGRRAKYLEIPWRESKAVGPKLVQKAIRKVTQ